MRGLSEARTAAGTQGSGRCGSSAQNHGVSPQTAGGRASQEGKAAPLKEGCGGFPRTGLGNEGPRHAARRAVSSKGQRRQGKDPTFGSRQSPSVKVAVRRATPASLTALQGAESRAEECLGPWDWPLRAHLSLDLPPPQVRSAMRKRWHRWQDHHSLRVPVARAMSIPTSPTRISFHSIKQTAAV